MSAPSSWRRAWRRASSSGVRLGHANALKYDGDEMWRAMQNAIDLTSDPELQADLYSELAWETSCRSGMWRRMPDYTTVDEWIELRSAAAEGSAARARALVAKGFWNPFEGSAPAREASAIAERLGDVELRSHAWDVRGVAEFVAGRYDLGRAFAERRFELLDRISDLTTAPTSTRRRSRAASGAVNFGRHVASPAFTTRSRCR